MYSISVNKNAQIISINYDDKIFTFENAIWNRIGRVGCCRSRGVVIWRMLVVQRMIWRMERGQGGGPVGCGIGELLCWARSSASRNTGW